MHDFLIGIFDIKLTLSEPETSWAPHGWFSIEIETFWAWEHPELQMDNLLRYKIDAFWARDVLSSTWMILYWNWSLLSLRASWAPNGQSSYSNLEWNWSLLRLTRSKLQMHDFLIGIFDIKLTLSEPETSWAPHGWFSIEIEAFWAWEHPELQMDNLRIRILNEIEAFWDWHVQSYKCMIFWLESNVE